MLKTSGPSPPESQAKPSKRGLMIIIAVLTLFGGICLFLILGLINMVIHDFQGWRDEITLAHSGVTATAGVVDRYQTQAQALGEPASTTDLDFYIITYQFEAATSQGSEQFTRQATVGPQTYAGLQIGDTVTIRYLPDQPELSRMAGEIQPSSFLLLLICVVSVLGLLGLLTHFRSHFTHRKLAAI